MKIIRFRSLTLACALGGPIAGGMFASNALAEPATVTGRVTNASGQPEVNNKPVGGCVLRPDGSCGEAQATVREVNDPPECLPAGETDRPDQSRSVVASPVATEAPVGPPGAPVNTTRSNKKAGVAAKATVAPIGPPGAPVVTSRSNKKAGVVAVCEAGDAMGEVSTTR